MLVPGLLLLGIDARFVAAASLFLQVLVIPVAAGSHYRVGHFNRKLAIPLIIGGMIGAFIGPFVAAQLPKDVIARLVAAMIITVGVIVFATLRRGAPRIRPRGRRRAPGARRGHRHRRPASRPASPAPGWGPVGGTMLLLSRIDPKQAIGSSLFARVFMAIAAVVGLRHQRGRVPEHRAQLVDRRAAARRLDRADDPRARWSSPSSAASGQRS